MLAIAILAPALLFLIIGILCEWSMEVFPIALFTCIVLGIDLSIFISAIFNTDSIEDVENDVRTEIVCLEQYEGRGYTLQQLEEYCG